MKRLLLAIWLIIGAVTMAGCATCVQSHTVTNHHDAYDRTSYRTVGKRKVPYTVHQSAYDSQDKVCDKWQK